MSKITTEMRKVRKSDLKEIQYICEQCFPGDDAFEIAEPLIDIEHYYVAINDSTQQIVGFVIFGIYSIDTAHIMMFAVHPNYQRQGIGTQILDFTLEKIRESTVGRVRLEVKIQNNQAINFYKKHDFIIKGVLKEYYDDLSDGYLMVKEF